MGLKKIDYLIVGQGLAGSLLAWELLARKKKIIIVDNAKQNASLVAAGLINPVTGMRLVKSTNVDSLLPFATHFYQQLSAFFKLPFYIEQSMLRILRNDKELQLSKKRLLQPEYQKYLDRITPSNALIHSNFGLLTQKKTGYLLTKPLLKTLKEYFISINAYIHSEIDYADIKIDATLKWKGIQAKQIIFCQGHLGINNPWFSALPFKPVKGEIITAATHQPLYPSMLNFGHWFIPLDQSQFRLGATFDRENLNTTPSSNTSEILLKSLKQVYPSLPTTTLLSHEAGIRPATHDRQPFVGSHPTENKVIIFNGFGAKGSLQIPWHCKILADHLLNKTPLPIECDIQRYSKQLLEIDKYES